MYGYISSMFTDLREHLLLLLPPMFIKSIYTF